MLTWISGRWIRYEEPGRPGAVYVRLDGEGEVTEVHVDKGGAPITAADLRSLPLARIRSMALDPAMTDWCRWDEPDPDAPEPMALLRLAFGRSMEEKEWHSGRQETRLEPSSAAEGLTPAFLQTVADAYRAAVERGDRPNKALAEQSGHPQRTVERWVYLARKSGALAPTRQGRV